MKKSVAYLGVFLALAMILSYVEAILPFAIGIPGVKLGLANLVTVLMLYLIGERLFVYRCFVLCLPEFYLEIWSASVMDLPADY